MALFVPQLTFNKFRKGEVVEIDESEWERVIERGWLKPYSEGEIEESSAQDPGDQGDGHGEAPNTPASTGPSPDSADA